MLAAQANDPSRFGLNTRNWHSLESILAEVLGNSRTDVYIFGSRARGDYKTYSDLDLLIVSDAGNIDTLKSQLIERFEESDLPVHIDLVLEPDLLEAYREQIMREKVLAFSLPYSQPPA